MKSGSEQIAFFGRVVRPPAIERRQQAVGGRFVAPVALPSRVSEILDGLVELKVFSLLGKSLTERQFR